MGYALRLWFRIASKRTAVTGFLIASLAVALAGGVCALALNSAILWRDLPFEEAHHLLSLQVRDKDSRSRWVSWRELQAIAEPPAAPFRSVAGFTSADFNALSEPGLSAEPLAATVVSSGFFGTLGLAPAIGQLPVPGAYGATGERVVVLTHDFWQRRYGGDEGVVGRTVRLAPPEYMGGREDGYRIVAVLPKDAWLLWDGVDVVVPMRADAARLSDPSQGLFERIVGRIDDEATVSSARAAEPLLLDRLRGAGSNRGASAVALTPLQDALFRDLRPQLRVVLWLAALVFLLAGMNVVIAFVAQEADQRRSTAIRLAVGASHLRLMADTLRQNAITLLVAAGASVVIGQWLLAGVGSAMPDGWLSRIPGQVSGLRVDTYVLTWLLIALAVMLAVSGAALHVVVRGVKPWGVLAALGTEHHPRSSAWRSGLVGIEIALCSAVVITSSSLVGQLAALRAVNLGVDDTRASAIWVNLGSAALTHDDSRIDYYDRILRDVSGLPGIESVGGVDLPFHLDWQTVRTTGASGGTADVPALTRAATPGYLTASGIHLIDGRWFSEGDRANGEDVAVISESLARAWWPEGSPLGQRVTAIDAEKALSSATVVGVVSDTRHAPYAPPDRVLYRPVAQVPPPWLYLVIKALPGAIDPVASVKEAIWRINPDQPIDGPWSVSDWRNDRTVHLGFLTRVSIVLGVVGVALAAAGLYGLSAWAVASARRQIAVRKAVGASDWQIGSWFLYRWLRIIVPGLAGGWVLQSATTSILISAVEGLQAPRAVAVFIGICVMGGAAAAAIAVPLRRAMASDSSVLLRE